MSYLLIDIGGTHTRISVSSGGSIGKPEKFRTEHNFDKGILDIKKYLDSTKEKDNVEGAIVGIAGPLDKEKKKLVNSPNLPNWVNKKLKRELEKCLSVPVFIKNDTELAGLGEAVYGAGKGYRIVAYMTISTGIGGVRIVDKEIDVNAFGFEIGHQIISYSSNSRNPMHLEDVISGSALKRFYMREPHDIKDQKIWDEFSTILSYAINNTIVYWSPDVVVLGGGIMKEKGINIENIKKDISNIMSIFPVYSEIKMAELADYGGLYGALSFSKSLR